MLHLHFGTGRLGLGLVVPFLRTSRCKTHLFNRDAPRPCLEAPHPGGNVDAATRNELLATAEPGYYWHRTLSNASREEAIAYDGFVTYPGSRATQDASALRQAIDAILDEADAQAEGIIVSASLREMSAYGDVVEALRHLAQASNARAANIGTIYFVACENLFRADDVLREPQHAIRLPQAARARIHCVSAMVDRICSNLVMRATNDDHAAALEIQTESYGVLRLETAAHTEALPSLLEGSAATFSRHLAAERDVKRWLLNGSHWLIAVNALRETAGDASVKLNEFILASDEHARFAREILAEMREGVEAALRKDHRYHAFLDSIDIDAYLNRATASTFARFTSSDDTLVRILSRFRAPSLEEVTTIQGFVAGLLQKIEPPLLAYSEKHGSPAKSSTRALFDLFHLQAAGMYANSASAEMQTPANVDRHPSS